MINRFTYIDNIRTILAYDTLHGKILHAFTRMHLQKEISNQMNNDAWEAMPNEKLMKNEKVAFIIKKIEETNWESPIDYKFDEETRTFTPVYKNEESC